MKNADRNHNTIVAAIAYPSNSVTQLLLRLFNNTIFIIKTIFNEPILSYITWFHLLNRTMLYHPFKLIFSFTIFLRQNINVKFHPVQYMPTKHHPNWINKYNNNTGIQFFIHIHKIDMIPFKTVNTRWSKMEGFVDSKTCAASPATSATSAGPPETVW